MGLHLSSLHLYRVYWLVTSPTHSKSNTDICIVIIYSCISPLIVGFAAIAFGLLYIAFRYNMIYSQDTLALDTHGRAFAKATQQLSTGVYLAEICLAGLFGISTGSSRKAAGPLALMIALLVITAVYHAALNHTIKSLEKNVGNDVEADPASKEGPSAADRIRSVGQKPVGILVKILRPPPVPAFESWLSSPLSEYMDETRREAYLNPAIWKPTPKLWIVHDEMGISTREVTETGKVIEITDTGAWFDEKGKVTTLLAEPEEKGESVNKATSAPIWEDPVYY